jgi:uncharacterized protein YkwD
LPSFSDSECGIHPKAQELAAILINSSQQLHPKLVCNSTLAQAANAKAKLMAENKRVDHILNRQTPNQLLRSYGIDLPRIYEPSGNQVEAISGGKETAQSAFDYFMTSPPHKAHLLGENEFYKTQNEIAVGYYYDFYTPHEHYWVVYVTAFDGKDTDKYSFQEVPSK